MGRRLWWLVLAFAWTCAGCHFGRVVVNEHVRELDTKWIKPGQTTRAEVVAKLGLPAAVKDVGVGLTKNTLRWVSVDTDERSFEGGYILTPTFSSDSVYYANDILVVTDDNGVVTLVSHVAHNGKGFRLIDWREAGK